MISQVFLAWTFLNFLAHCAITKFSLFSGIHESLYCIIAIGLETIAGLSLPFVKSLNEYYGIQVLTIVQYGVWANARTLITFCIDSNEIGKVYASVGIGKNHALKK